MRKLFAIALAVAACCGIAQAEDKSAAVIDHSNMDHATHAKQGADAVRQAVIAERGKDVMPFSLAATTHIFTKTADGGVQRILARNPSDAVQVELVRQHLQDIRTQFLKGDFSGPAYIHGQDMPGLAILKGATPGQVGIAYSDIEGGAQLTYQTRHAMLATALHQWFDAQLSDHGKDAVEGHSTH